MPKSSRKRKRLDPETAQIAIIGSGLAGLSAAVSLEQQGFRNIRIYERDASWNARKEGYGLTLQYSSTALRKLGILDDISEADCPSRSHYLFHSDGTIHGYFGNEFSPERGWGQRGNLRVPRQTVRKILMNELDTTTICWDHQLTGIQSTATVAGATRVVLHFEHDLSAGADLVIGADGVRSSLVRQWIPETPPPQPLGIRLILGLTENFTHPLVDQRGFYTLSKGMRLFVMPYSTPCPVGSSEERSRYMWQLSFRSDKQERFTSKALQKEALRLTAAWHSPVATMINSTPLSSIWGTQLYDRDPVHVYEQLVRKAPHNILVIGDALHPMSPFKGQGANQCLADGVCVGNHLAKSSLQSAVNSCMREIVQRTRHVVLASREAARYWHSNEALQAPQSFAGMPDTFVSTLLELGITAETQSLDAAISKVISNKGLVIPLDDKQLNSNDHGDKIIQIEAFNAIYACDRGTLRRLSWKRPMLLRSLRDKDHQWSLLHVASAVGDWKTVRWLLEEAGCSVSTVDVDGSKPIDLAKDDDVKTILKRKMMCEGA